MSVEKLQHKWLQRRCEAAADKVEGSLPKVLARVLAYCGRYLELLSSEGAEMTSFCPRRAYTRLKGGGWRPERDAVARSNHLTMSPSGPRRSVCLSDTSTQRLSTAE